MREMRRTAVARTGSDPGSLILRQSIFHEYREQCAFRTFVPAKGS